jgi:hypothetical protein
LIRVFRVRFHCKAGSIFWCSSFRDLCVVVDVVVHKEEHALMRKLHDMSTAGLAGLRLREAASARLGAASGSQMVAGFSIGLSHDE